MRGRPTTSSGNANSWTRFGRQVREFADVHFAAVVRDLNDQFANKLAELNPLRVAEPTEPAVSDPAVEPASAPGRKSYWSWIIL